MKPAWMQCARGLLRVVFWVKQNQKQVRTCWVMFGKKGRFPNNSMLKGPWHWPAFCRKHVKSPFTSPALFCWKVLNLSPLLFYVLCAERQLAAQRANDGLRRYFFVEMSRVCAYFIIFHCCHKLSCMHFWWLFHICGSSTELGHSLRLPHPSISRSCLKCSNIFFLVCYVGIFILLCLWENIPSVQLIL